MVHGKSKVILATLAAIVLGWAGSAMILKSVRLALEVGPDQLASTLLYQSADAAEGEPVVHRYYLHEDAPAPPEIAARGYVLADLLTGGILLQHNPDNAYPIASVSKLTTATVAIEHALATTTWFYPLLLESSNETAERIAASFGRKQFLQWMNEFAATRGMGRTHYADPSGISPKNVSSASDLLALVQYIYNNKPEVFAITHLPTKGKWANNNQFVQQNTEYYIGGKSGFTPEAGGTLVSLFDLPLSNGEVRPFVIIILGTDNAKGVKYELAQSLVDYLKKYVYYQ